MTLQLGHTIVHSRDGEAGARWFAGLCWADPLAHHPGEINHHDSGRGVYFQSPDGHWLEITTVPYGGQAVALGPLRAGLTA